MFASLQCGLDLLNNKIRPQGVLPWGRFCSISTTTRYACEKREGKGLYGGNKRPPLIEWV